MLFRFRQYYDTQQCQKNMTPIIFSIYSDMCVMGGCGKYGRCYQFFSGGNMFSTCTCYAGKLNSLTVGTTNIKIIIRVKVRKFRKIYRSLLFLMRI